MYSRRVPRVREVNAWTRALEARRARGDALLDLAEFNPTRAGLSAPLAIDAEAMRAAQAAPYAPHPRGLPEARAAIAAYYATRGATLDPEHLVLTSGTSESYAHLFRLLCDPGQAVAVPVPGYPLIAPIAAAEGVAIEPYRLDPDEHWAPDPASLERALARGARAVVVVQPQHPTGCAFDAEALARVERLCASYGAAIVSDEVFGDHPWPGHAAVPTLLGARAVPTFVLHGLSKLCGLPQWKLGWIAVCGPSRARDRALEGLEWLADLFLSVSTPVQRLAPALLATRHAFLARIASRVAENLATLREGLAVRPEMARVPAQAGWSGLLRVPARASDEAWALALLARGVLVHPGHFYDLEPGSLLVVSLIVEPRGFRAGIEALGSLEDPV